MNSARLVVGRMIKLEPISAANYLEKLKQPKVRPNLGTIIMNFKTDLHRITICENLDISETLLSGSCAEFVIDPFQSGIGDVDIMCQQNSEIAYFHDTTNISASILNSCDRFLHSETRLFRILFDANYPSYVTVVFSGILKISRIDTLLTDFVFEPDEKFLTRNSEHPLYEKLTEFLGKLEQRGPAINNFNLDMFYEMDGHYGSIPHDNLLNIISSPFWPPTALEWLTRKRINGWPALETTYLVVRNGCHIVPVAHIDCSENEYQWRISFSKAESILIRSWTPIQQNVYHMLRYFAKKELIRKEWKNTDEILSMYSLKTLMLWQCEGRSIKLVEFEKTQSTYVAIC